MTRPLARPARTLRVVAVAATAALALSVTAAGTATAAGDHSAARQKAARTMAPQKPTAGQARSGWPVRTRTGTLTYHPVTPSGDPSQQFNSVSVIQDKAAGTIAATLRLRGVPTAATDSRTRVGFGVVRTGTNGPTCTPLAGSTPSDFHSYGTSGAYHGAVISFRESLSGARTGTYNCAFAEIMSQDGTTLYDAVTGALTDHIQKPIIAIKVPGKRLKHHGFTKIKIKIANSSKTIATAKNAKLHWRTHGLAIRANKHVGSIAPGHAKVGHFYLKDTGRNGGSVKLTVTSGNYHHSITLHVHTVRR